MLKKLDLGRGRLEKKGHCLTAWRGLQHVACVNRDW